MSAFLERNDIRKKQLAHARNSWVREVGDRIQLSRDWQAHRAWDSGHITHLGRGILGVSVPCQLTTIQMDDGSVYAEETTQTSSGGAVDFIPIVPHEDYFKTKDSA